MSEETNRRESNYSAIKCDHCANDAKFRADNSNSSTNGWQFVCLDCSLNPALYNIQTLNKTKGRKPLGDFITHPTECNHPWRKTEFRCSMCGLRLEP